MATAQRTPDVEETLAWEAEQRPRAGWAAVLAGVLILAGPILRGSGTGGQPSAPFVESLKRAFEGQPDRESLRVALFEFLDDKSVLLIASSVVSAVGFLALIAALGYLYRATVARRPVLPRAALILALAGPALAGVALVVFQLALSARVSDFLAGDKSVASANDIGDSGVLTAAQILQTVGTLATAFALVLLALNAMRAGLLTRFMGILGIIAGAALVLLPQNPVLSFWLVALGFLILGRWPSGVPRAWETGREEPWPTAQQVREARDAGPPVDAGPPPDAPHVASKKKKRKRR